jgi:two-component system chemotaxis response regulator CheY
MGKLILVIDDSKTIRMIVTKALKAAGFETIEAGNGREGIEAVNASSPALVISDLNMPVMDGLEFARDLRSLPAHANTPLIFLTTETETGHMQAASATHHAAWLVKPFKAESLLEAVRGAIPS